MIELILIAAVSFWFAELSTLPQLFYLKTDYRLLVFNCSKCLSFWFSLIYCLTLYPIHISIFYAALTSLVAIIFSRIYYKLLS